MVSPSGASSSRDVVGQRQLDLFRAPRMGNAAAHPGDIGWRHAMVVLQDRAHPHIGGQLVFGQADAAAAQVFRLLDAVGADVDGGVAERARQEYRYADVGQLAVGSLDGGTGERQFADVEFFAAKRAEENFFRRQRHEDRIDPIDLDGAIDQGTATVVIADGHGELQFVHMFPWLVTRDNRSRPLARSLFSALAHR